MKKVYLSLFAIALASVSMAQGKVANKSAVKAKNFVSVTDQKAVKKEAVVSNKAILYTNTFNNAADWTLANTSNPAYDWEFTTDPTAIGVGVWSDGPFASTSVADGFALLNSDAQGQTATQDAYMTLNTPIDLSANPAVVLTFEQYHTRYLETTTVEVSGDNGSTWTEFVVNDAVAVNASTTNPELITLNISSVAGGQSQVLIRFHYVGAWDYGWAVDDLIIEEAAGNDIVVGKAFTHDIVNAYDYSIEASSQMQAMVVGVALNNLGGTAAVGATLNVNINDGTTDVYTTPATFDLAIGAADTVWVTTGMMPEANKTYTISFTVNADDNTANNASLPVSFSTSDVAYAQDFTVDGIYRFNQDDETAMGNIFQINNATTLNAASVKFETGTTAVSAIIRVSRFNFNDANFNSVQNMEYVDEVEYVIPASVIGSGEFANINFNAPIALEAGWNYVLEVRKNAGADRIFIGGSDTGDDDFSTTCYGPFGANSAVNYFVAWGFSPAVRMSFVSAPTITSSDANNSLCSNETLTLTSSAAAGNTWTLDGTVIPNEVGTTLTVSASGTYAAVVNGIASAPITVSVTNIDATINNVLGTLAATQGGGATYQWVDCTNGNAPISGATAQIFAPTFSSDFGVQISLNGCSASSTCITITGVGINENEAVSSFNVYPNPATENVEVAYALKNNSTVNVTITDLSGKVVYASNLGNKVAGAHALNVNTTTFSNGIYVVNFATDNAVITEKLVIRK
jgi:hypothetical protein